MHVTHGVEKELYDFTDADWQSLETAYKDYIGEVYRQKLLDALSKCKLPRVNEDKVRSVETEIISVKKGQKKNPNEVEAITGATISSKAVARLLDNTINEWRGPIDEYLSANDLSLSQKIMEKNE